MMRAAAYVYSHSFPNYHLVEKLTCSLLMREKVRVIKNLQEVVNGIEATFSQQVSGKLRDWSDLQQLQKWM